MFLQNQARIRIISELSPLINKQTWAGKLFACVDFINYFCGMQADNQTIGTTVSVVLFNTPESIIKPLINSLLNSDVVDLVYFIDNSPAANALESLVNKLMSEYPDMKYEYIKSENKGYGAGHNIALRKTIKNGARYHLVVNPDVRWKGKVLETLIDYLDGHPKVGQIMPLTLYPDGSLQRTCRLLPTPLDLFMKRFLPARLCRRRMERYLLPPEAYRHILNGPYLLGSFMLFRIEAISQTGLFDERFFMYPEDIDITRRIHRNWETILYPYVSIIHDHAAASRHNYKMLWIHITNMCKYFNKWGWFMDNERRLFNRNLIEQVSKTE